MVDNVKVQQYKGVEHGMIVEVSAKEAKRLVTSLPNMYRIVTPEIEQEISSKFEAEYEEVEPQAEEETEEPESEQAETE